MIEVAHDANRVDRRDAVPLYHQIFLALRDEILSGRRAFGSAVPTELELSAETGVSRITARRALAELARQRLVERRRRVGTRVVYRAPGPTVDASIDQAVESLLAFGRDTAVRVLEIAEEPASPAVAESLGIAVGAPVVRAVRLRDFGGEPLGRVVSYVPAELSREITPARLRSTPMLGLLREAGVEIGAAGQTISALAADSVLAAVLGLEARSPMLRIERTVADSAGRKVLLTVADYRADRYRIRLDLDEVARFKPDLG
jgi:GntR family transcriptional regulator